MEIKNQIKNCKDLNPSWGYKRIAAFVGCTPTNVRWHLNPEEKIASSIRRNRYRSKLKGVLKRKKDNFQSIGPYNPATKRCRRSRLPSLFSADQLESKLLNSPICYLTGKTIDLEKPKTYELDHIIPVSQNGDNSLDNCGLATRAANRAKHDLTPEEFEQLCVEVLTHRGYSVTKLAE